MAAAEILSPEGRLARIIDHPAVRIAVPVIIGALAVVVLHKLAAHVKWADVKADLSAASWLSLSKALGFAALSFAGISLYDALATRAVAPGKVPFRIAALAGAGVKVAAGAGAIVEAADRPADWVLSAIVGAAGLPPGALNVVSNAPADARAVVDALIAHPAVRRVSFTGSTRVGRLIAESCARHLKRALLELGGKAPMVVLDDADLDAAVQAAAFGAYANQGQICMSTERLVVDASVADAFVEKLAAKVRTLRAGVPGSEGCVLGAMIDRDAVDRVRSMIDDAMAKGAVLVAGGEAEGTVMQPALLDHVTPAMRLYRDESFGPVVGVVRVHSVEEAVTVANDNDYGLAAAVFGRDVVRALAVARQIDSGICHVNAATVHDEPQMPFGGVKASGYGRFGGTAAIDEFTELRWITVQGEPAHYPF